MAGSSAEEQLYIELLNETRLDPLASAARYITSYSPLVSSDPNIQSAIDYFRVNGAALQAAYAALIPVGPVAWNESLANAAAGHNAAMIAADEQSHQVAGEANIAGRAEAAGYTGWNRLGENVYAYSRDPVYGHAGFMIDWGPGTDGMQTPPGHRNNIMNGAFREVGVDVIAETNPNTMVGPTLVTQDFGTRAGAYFVLGVAYTDSDADRFYSIGEGRSGLTVKVGAASTTTGASGGYSLGVATGALSVVLSGAGLANAVTVNTTITTENIKLDVVNGNTLLASGAVVINDAAITTLRGLGARGLSLTAGAGDQTVEGTSGDDTLTGGAGNDLLIGNGGNDIAVFSGNRADYTITAEGGGYRLVDKRAGSSDGTDLARGIEQFRFADGTVAAASLIPNALPVAGADVAATGKDKSVTISVLANDSDPNGDALKVSALGNPTHGTAAVNADGTIRYTPTTGYVGADSFNYTISDGNGGTATATVSVTVTADPRYRLIGVDGFAGGIKGGGEVFGTNGFQDISVLADSGRVVLDASFGRGGDVVRLQGAASTYTIELSGSSAVVKHGATQVVIPIGVVGLTLVFDDGARKLAYDLASSSAKIGAQSFGATSATITAAADGTAATGSAIASATARLLLSEGGDTAVSGRYEIFGSNGSDHVQLQHGQFTLDASFGRGGDVISLEGSVGGYTAYVSGSQVILADSNTRVAIPVSTAGAVLDFADADRSLRYDTASASVMIGSQSIPLSSQSAIVLSAASASVAMDLGIVNETHLLG